MNNNLTHAEHKSSDSDSDASLIDFDTGSNDGSNISEDEQIIQSQPYEGQVIEQIDFEQINQQEIDDVSNQGEEPVDLDQVSATEIEKENNNDSVDYYDELVQPQYVVDEDFNKLYDNQQQNVDDILILDDNQTMEHLQELRQESRRQLETLENMPQSYNPMNMPQQQCIRSNEQQEIKQIPNDKLRKLSRQCDFAATIAIVTQIGTSMNSSYKVIKRTGSSYFRGLVNITKFKARQIRDSI